MRNSTGPILQVKSGYGTHLSPRAVAEINAAETLSDIPHPAREFLWASTFHSLRRNQLISAGAFQFNLLLAAAIPCKHRGKPPHATTTDCTVTDRSFLKGTPTSERHMNERNPKTATPPPGKWAGGMPVYVALVIVLDSWRTLEKLGLQKNVTAHALLVK